MFPVTEASKVQPSSQVMSKGGLEEFRMNLEIYVMARKAS